MKATDAAWAAGFLDGEGHFSIRTHLDRYLVPQIEAAQVGDERPILRLQELMGGCRFVSRRERPVYRWTLAGGKGVRATVPSLLPYLVVKREQALLVLALCERMLTFRVGGQQQLSLAEFDARWAIRDQLLALRRPASNGLRRRPNLKSREEIKR